MRAIKKPVEIEFWPNENNTSLADLKKWTDSIDVVITDYFDIDESNLYVKTLEGTSYVVTNDDVIIRGIKGELYPCKKDIFKATYHIC